MNKKKHISKRMGLNISGHQDIDFLDINLKHDTKLFLDPCLIESCEDDFSVQCSRTISDFFGGLYWAYKQDDQRKVSSYLTHVGERNEAKLGYGTGLNGKAKTTEGMMETLTDLKHLIQSGISLEHAIDIPLFLPRFAEDCMSDMLMNILYKHFSEYTVMQCHKYGVPTSSSKDERHYWDSDEHRWKRYEGENLIIDGKIILLIPKRYICTKLYYSTGHFFMSQIAPKLQKRDTIIVDGKEKKPNKIEIKKLECSKHGSLLSATRENAITFPWALTNYHLKMVDNYSDRCLSDEELDYRVY